MNSSEFENIYDKYCPMLYDIALQICKSAKKSEELLIYTFRKIHERDISHKKYPAYCITLIHLLIESGKELYPSEFKNGLRLKQFVNAPVLNQIICEQISLQDYCNGKYLSQEEGLQIIRKEFSTIRNYEKKRKPSPRTSTPVNVNQ